MIKAAATNTRRIAWGAALLAALACGTAFAQPTQNASAAPAAGDQNSVKLTTVLMALPAGTPWLAIRKGLLCGRDDIVRNATGGRDPQDLPPFSAAFKAELDRVGYKVLTAEENLFDRQDGASDYQVAAVITDAHVVACMSQGGLISPGNLGDARGDGSMKIDWQVYSPLKKQVVARISTSGAVKLDNTVPGGVARLITDSFASNVRELAASPEFRAALSAPKASAKEFTMPGQQSKILLAGSLKAPGRRIDDAVGSVVMLQTGSGSGSGVLVSDDGYMLTNAHVVGDEKTVRVRWSDRMMTLAEVVRVAKDRDIALIKTNPRERAPLALKRGAVSPGQRVYAIGTPRDETFQSTVSSGVVSGNRIIDGLRFIQSDVSISPGSSGGALLDETGAVIGITVLHYLNNGQPAALNMFIPIGDAMDFLSLEQR